MDNPHEDYSYHEFPIFSDSKIVGDCNLDNNVYELQNMLGFLGNKIKIKESILVRIKAPITRNTYPDIRDHSKNNYTNYHEGTIVDEIAAVLSLYLGLRTWAGQETRVFKGKDDRFGNVRTNTKDTDHFLVKNGEHHLFHLNVEGNINGIFFEGIKTLTPKKASAFVKSCRSYQKALWYASIDKNTSWVLLVSAVEILAKEHFTSKKITAINTLKTVKPDWLLKLKETNNNELVEYMADELKYLLNSTSSFVRFLSKFLPPPPKNRPANIHQIDWTQESLCDAFKVIYEHRSRFLHAATPFPYPMCETSFSTDEKYEKPAGLSTSYAGGVWKKDILPMHLHIFEYIVRNTVKKWFEDEAKAFT